MIVKVFLFAGAREIIGQPTLEVRLDESEGFTVERLRLAIEREFPQLKSLLDCSRIALDHEFASPQQVIAPSADVALIPPVSGG